MTCSCSGSSPRANTTPHGIRRFFNFLTLLSLLLGLAVAVLWVRSGDPTGDQLVLTVDGRLWWVMSVRGRIHVRTVAGWPGHERVRWVADKSWKRLPMVAFIAPGSSWRRLGISGGWETVHTAIDERGAPVSLYESEAYNWREHRFRHSAPMPSHLLRVPHWMLLAAFALMPLALAATRAARHVSRQRRRRAGRCTTCGYDLRGNVSGTCPECGNKHSAAEPQP